MPIDQIIEGDLAATQKVNAAIRKANLVDGKADRFELTSAVAPALGAAASATAVSQTVLAALTAKADRSVVGSQLAGKASAATVDALKDRVDAEEALAARRRFEAVADTARPGDGPVSFTIVDAVSGLAGLPEDLPLLPLGAIAVDSDGHVARFRAPVLVGMRRAVAIEPDRVLRLRVALRRRADASDPANDAVRIGVVWLDPALNVITSTVVNDLTGLDRAGGRRVVKATCARSAGVGIDLVAPYNARYLRLFTQLYSTTAITDIEVMTVDDVTDAVAPVDLGPDDVARIAVIESLDAGERLDALEAAADIPSTLTFRTRADAMAATVAVSVTGLRLLGYGAIGDGGDALYKRAMSEPGHAGKFQSADGAWWSLGQQLVSAAHFGGDEAARDAYLKGWSPPLATLAFAAAGGDSAPRTLLEKVHERVSLVDYRLVIHADDCAAWTAAQAALGLDGGIVHLPPRQIVLGSATIELTKPVSYIGEQWAENSSGIGGTWLHFPNPAIQAFHVSSVDVRGITFSNIGLSQDHPTPGPGWAPADYPFVFDVEDTFGSVRLFNVLGLNINRLIRASNSGRLTLIGVHGQFFTKMVELDRCYDKPWFDMIDAWPYWTSQDDVIAYQQANLDLLHFLRVDTPFLGLIFAYGARSQLRISGSGGEGGGTTTRAKITAMQGDAVGCGIWIDSTAIGADLQYGMLDVQCEDWLNRGLGLTDSDGLRIEADNVTIFGGPVRTDVCGRNAVRITGANCRFRPSGGWLRTWNAKVPPNVNVPAIYIKSVGLPSEITFASPPLIQPWAGQKTLNDDCNGIVDFGLIAGYDNVAKRTAVYPPLPGGLMLTSSGYGHDVRLGLNGRVAFRVDEENEEDDNGVSPLSVLLRHMAESSELILEGPAGSKFFFLGPGPIEFGAGTYQKPVIINGISHWWSAAGKFRALAGLPTSDNDGIAFAVEAP